MPSSWRTLLLLLSRTPDEVRNDGGIAHLWGTAGGPSVEIREIDYAEVLREKRGLQRRARSDHRRRGRTERRCSSMTTASTR